MELTTDYKEFVFEIKRHTGIDLFLYKQNQMHRRLESLRNKRGFTNFLSYIEACKKDRILFDELLDRITINVSEFFRNPLRWEQFAKQTLPSLIKDKTSLRCWSAACSTGDEPYTLAMVLKEHAPQLPFSIIATDLDPLVLQRAKEGVYTENALKDCPEYYKKKYFTQQNNTFRISESIKENITFKKHNLLKDNFDNSLDLIICRNVTIYFTEEAKNTLYQRFSDALRPKGILFVGATEQIFAPEQFSLVGTEPFFYQKVK